MYRMYQHWYWATVLVSKIFSSPFLFKENYFTPVKHLTKVVVQNFKFRQRFVICVLS
jgi:hypothetical protein